MQRITKKHNQSVEDGKQQQKYQQMFEETD